MKLSIICFLIGFVFANVANLTLPNKDLLLEGLRTPAFNAFKLPTLIVPKLKGPELEIVEDQTENAVIYGFSTAELKSYNLNPTDCLLDIVILIRNLTLDYDITFKGKIHSEDIDFKGHGHQTLENSEIKIIAKFDIFKQEDEQYLKLLDGTVYWKLGQLVSIDLIDQNGKSDERMMKLTFDHWTGILKEEEHVFVNLLRNIFLNQLNATLSKLPLL